MEKVREYRRRAQDCRDAAAKAPTNLKSHYLELAATWESLANERLKFFGVMPLPQSQSAGVED